MYEITIVKKVVVPIIKREYERVADTGNPRDNGAMYDYVDCLGERTVETDILKQTLEDIDLPAVIKAINKI